MSFMRQRQILLGSKPRSVDDKLKDREQGELVQRQVREYQREQAGTMRPLRAYAIWLEKYKKQLLRDYGSKGEERFDRFRETHHLEPYIDMEREYCREGGKNNQSQWRGLPGTGKSWAAQSWIQKEYPDFDPYQETFFLSENLLSWVQKDAKKGTGFVMDEEPKRMGATSYSLEAMMENIELTSMRYGGISGAWVYVEQRSHKVNMLATSYKEHFIEHGKLDYITMQISQQYQNSDGAYIIGNANFDLPPPKKAEEYIKRKDDFVKTMIDTAGRGGVRDVMQISGDVLEKVKVDDTVTYLVETYSDTPKTLLNKLIRHISYQYGMSSPQAEAFAARYIMRK